MQQLAEHWPSSERTNPSSNPVLPESIYESQVWKIELTLKPQHKGLWWQKPPPPKKSMSHPSNLIIREITGSSGHSNHVSSSLMEENEVGEQMVNIWGSLWVLTISQPACFVKQNHMEGMEGSLKLRLLDPAFSSFWLHSSGARWEFAF